MKKTIAKIMAAAMLLSAIPAVTLPTLTADAAKLDTSAVSPSNVTAKSIALLDDGKEISSPSDYTESAPYNLTGVNYRFVSNTHTDENDYYDADAITPLTMNVLLYAWEKLASGSDTINATQLIKDGAYSDGSTNDTTVTLDGDLDYIVDLSVKTSSSEDVNWAENAYFNNEGKIVVGTRYGATKSAYDKVKALEAGSTSSVVKITATTNLKNSKSISIWVRFGAGTTASNNGMGFVLLKQDNAKYIQVPVNYSLDDNHYATIEEVTDKDTIKLDTAKGGRLLLDYVYQNGQAYEDKAGADNRGNASLTATSNAFKVRRIGSRVFKDGKFQQISGWGDDGAKYIRTINNGAFRSCKQLKKVNLDTEKKIRKINAKAFKGDKKLATVKMDGRNLKQIGSKAFEGTKSNITFKIKGNKTQFNKAVKKIKKQAPKKAKFSRI